MKISMKIGSWSAAAILAVICLAPANAFAASECAADSDCGEHFICEMASTPCPPPLPCDSTGGGECPDPPACEPEMEGHCAPAPPDSCDTASDCETGLVCVTYTYETCSGGATPDCLEGSGQECPDPEPFDESECTTETEGLCLPPYLAPCDVAADCGAGFECKAQEICSCTGSAGEADAGSDTPPGSPGEGSSDGGDSEANNLPSGTGEGSSEGDNGSSRPEEPDCTCEPTGVKYCDLPMQECQADADCAVDLVCAELPGAAGPSLDGICTSTPGGETVCEDVPNSGDEDPIAHCLPADYDRWIGSDIPGFQGVPSDDSASSGSENSNNNSSGPGNSGSAPSNSDRDRDFVSAEVDRGDSGSSADGSDTDEGCGCASTGNSLPGSAAALFFAMLGVVGLRRRSS